MMDPNESHDLTTLEGRVAVIRKARVHLLAGILDRAREIDPFPVIVIEPDGSGASCRTRRDFLKSLDQESTPAELCRLLTRTHHEPGVVFFVLKWGGQFSCTRTVCMPKESLEHN